jgi:hypothetical protein
VTRRAEDAVEADPAQCAQRRGDMAVRQRAGDREGVLPGGDDGAPLEHATQALDLSHRPVGKVAQRAFTDLAVLAIALAQENGGGRVPVGDGFDIHGPMMRTSGLGVQVSNLELHGYV